MKGQYIALHDHASIRHEGCGASQALNIAIKLLLKGCFLKQHCSSLLVVLLLSLEDMLCSLVFFSAWILWWLYESVLFVHLCIQCVMSWVYSNHCYLLSCSGWFKKWYASGSCLGFVSDLMMVTFSLYETWTSGCSVCSKCSKLVSLFVASIPKCAGIHCIVTLQVALKSFIALAMSGDLLFIRSCRTDCALVRQLLTSLWSGRLPLWVLQFLL